MADRKITVLNPAGYQELLQSGDSLLVDGDINLQTNRITGVPTPTLNVDAAPKSYVDTGDNTNATAITSLDTRLTSVEGTIAGGLGIEDSTVYLTGTTGITISGDTSFTLNQATDVNITIEGPDLSTYLNKPTTDGDFIVSKTGTNITYNDVIDLGSY